jgi:succinate dehydrogenase / fumarate reductase flavoprotein subunit
LRDRSTIGLKDNSKVFNTARIEALEVENLMEAAQATMDQCGSPQGVPRRPSRARLRTRRARTRPARWAATMPKWMKHTLWYTDGNRLDYKPVRMKPLTVETVPPKPRTF